MNAPVNVSADFAELSGLEQLKAAFSARGDFKGIGKTLNFRAVTLEQGFVVFEGHPTKDVYNPIGTVHGGYAATLLDSAMACAVHSQLKSGQGYTTLELKVAYHRAMTEESAPVRAEGKLISLGRRAAFAEGRLLDANGKLCATATTTCLVFSK
ncbi:MAG: PaaI family thioesterase [Proteobacteria bacterium]|nr:PaaI family thioesterase [Pseudomonadota bacterium]